jgi:hypothetical protein
MSANRVLVFVGGAFLCLAFMWAYGYNTGYRDGRADVLTVEVSR